MFFSSKTTHFLMTNAQQQPNNLAQILVYIQLSARILRPNASAQSIKNVFKRKNLPPSINQLKTKFALKAAATITIQ